MKRKVNTFDFTDCAVEVTGDALYLINGGAEIENSIAAQANAQVGDTVTNSRGETHTLTQGDINWAKDQIGSSGQNTASTPSLNSSSSTSLEVKLSIDSSTSKNRENSSLSVTKLTNNREHITTIANSADNNSSQIPYITPKTLDSIRWGYVPIEGVGINGTSVFSTNARLTENGKIEVYTLGKFLGTNLVDSSSFFGSVSLKVDGKIIEKKPYKKDTSNSIWNGNYDRVGIATFDCDVSNASDIKIVSDVDLLITSYGLGNSIVNYTPTVLELR